MTPPLVIKDVSAGYGELALVEQLAIDLLTTELGWTHENLFSETFGVLGTEGREREHQVILARRLRAALEKLNPGFRPDAHAQAVEHISQDRSKQIAVNANRELYRLLKEGVKVSIAEDRGGFTTKTLRVINRIPVLLPSKDVLRRFEDSVNPILWLRANLVKTTSNLRMARDHLLPKPMNGEVEVAALRETETLAT